MSWNWDHLRYFLALADTGTLSEAARQLGVSHSTVQRRVRVFEQTLNTQLFDRVIDGYVLTASGRALHCEAVKMRASIDAVSNEILDSDRLIEGMVVITTTDTLAYKVLPKLLYELSIRHNGLRFTLTMLNRFSDIHHHEAHIGIRTGREPPPELIGRKIGSIEFKACASSAYLKQYPLTAFPTDPAEHRFVVLDDSYANTPVSRWLHEKLTPESRLTTGSNFLTCASLCRAGLGITLLPSYLLVDDPELVELPLQNPIPHNDLWILSHTDYRDTERVRVVRHYLYEQLRQTFKLESEISLAQAQLAAKQ